MRETKGKRLSPANRKWLAEVRACEKTGESLKGYAERKGVSVHALYQAKKRAREQGLLPPHQPGKTQPASPRPDRPPRFVEALHHAEPREMYATSWRVRLPGGALFESMVPLSIDDAVRLVESLREQS
jgi:transposase